MGITKLQRNYLWGVEHRRVVEIMLRVYWVVRLTLIVLRPL